MGIDGSVTRASIFLISSSIKFLQKSVCPLKHASYLLTVVPSLRYILINLIHRFSPLKRIVMNNVLWQNNKSIQWSNC